MGNVIDITTELAQSARRRQLARIGRMTPGRRSEILANPIQAVADVEDSYSSEIERLRRAMREACRALRCDPQPCEAQDGRGAGATAAERILDDAVALPWRYEPD